MLNTVIRKLVAQAFNITPEKQPVVYSRIRVCNKGTGSVTLRAHVFAEKTESYFTNKKAVSLQVIDDTLQIIVDSPEDTIVSVYSQNILHTCEIAGDVRAALHVEKERSLPVLNVNLFGSASLALNCQIDAISARLADSATLAQNKPSRSISTRLCNGSTLTVNNDVSKLHCVCDKLAELVHTNGTIHSKIVRAA